MRRALAALLSLAFAVMGVRFARDGQWVQAVVIVVLGGWSVWYFVRTSAPDVAPLDATDDQDETRPS
jgi:hypothetical protein